MKHDAKKPFRCNWCGRFFTQKSSLDKHQRDYCRSKPEKNKPTSLLSVGLNVDSASVMPQQQLQHFDQPVNLTAGVKDMSAVPPEMHHSLDHSTHTIEPDMNASVQHMSQGLGTFDSYHLGGFQQPVSACLPVSASELYGGQALWMPPEAPQHLDPSADLSFHQNDVSHTAVAVSNPDVQ